MTSSKVHISLDSQIIACSVGEIASTFAGLLHEMKVAVPFLHANDREVLRKIMACEPATLTVAELFPDFERGSEAHDTLRRLRTAQFIRPAGRDMWDRGSQIDIKPFARLAWNRIGEAGIFGDEPERELDIVEDDEIDLSRPEVNDPEEAATIHAKKSGAEMWEDDDVLDYLKDDTKD